MADTVQFTLTATQMAAFLDWRAQVEAETGAPLDGILFSYLVTKQGYRQIIVRPSTDQDFKLKNIARLDGTYDTFAPHEEILAECDDLGFASLHVLWHDVGLKLYLCDGTILGKETTPRCYAERVHDPHQPLLPFRVSEAPELLEEDILLQVFSSTPLPPVLYQRIQHFIRTNVAVLLQHWYGEIGSFALLDVLQPPGGSSPTEESPRPEDG